jgi:hypothetical protein
MSKKSRLAYIAVFCLLLVAEIFIALFVRDTFVRPYIGDVLVTVLLCCLCRAVVPTGIAALPVYIFILAMLVEAAQYFEIVRLLGLENNTIVSTIIGTTFSTIDLICYGIGCLAFWVIERLVKNFIKTAKT